MNAATLKNLEISRMFIIPKFSVVCEKIGCYLFRDSYSIGIVYNGKRYSISSSCIRAIRREENKLFIKFEEDASLNDILRLIERNRNDDSIKTIIIESIAERDILISQLKIFFNKETVAPYRSTGIVISDFF